MGARADLAVRELGEGPPLVLLNGYAASKEDWDPSFLATLASSSTLICPDNRGIGSGVAPDDLSVASMAADVVALLDRRRIELADVAGWSMGGFIAQQLAAGAPGRVRRLVLLSTDHGGPGAVTAPDAVWAQLIDHGGSPREQASRLLKLLFPAEFADQLGDDVVELVASARALLSPATLFAQEAAITAWRSAPARHRLSSISAPTFIAAGAEDVVIPPANSRLLADAIVGARFELYGGGGHAFMAQEPTRLGAPINRFLGR
jgi:pimeloyl-ACP methyl ester carboxylesterase